MKHLKCIIFLIAYGEMHDLAWKRKPSLIKFLRMNFIDLLHYLQKGALIIGKDDTNILDKE